MRQGLPIPIAVSARHAHLSQASLDRLFGPGHVLTPHGKLAQTGQFSAAETVSLIGPRGRIDHVRLIGPARARDQVEISRSDAFTLGIDAPIRLSGDLTDSAGVAIEGPCGRIELEKGVIVALRHIHMSPTDAVLFGVENGDKVAVRIDSRDRDVVFEDVTVRIDPSFRLQLHLDTDEANAAGVDERTTAKLLLRESC
jgi:propanediol utilization protein